MDPRRLVAGLLVAGQIASLPPALAEQEAAPPAAPESEAAQPKFVLWGVVVQTFFSLAFRQLVFWLRDRVTPMPESGALAYEARPTMLVLIETIAEALRRFAARGGEYAGLEDVQPKGAFALAANTTASTPDEPLRIVEGRPNYQGLHVAVAIYDPVRGAVTGLRPLREGFRTGEKFKLRIAATFSGLLAVDNINPLGVQRQIYPPALGTVAVIEGGQEVFVPAGRDEYFEFAHATGEEKLLITMRDPRSLVAPSTARPSREDLDQGTNFVQKVDARSYPAIAEILTLTHLPARSGL